MEQSTLSLLTFLLVLLFFHVSEYLLTWYLNPKDISLSSFLISKQYACGIFISLAEFAIEYWLFPNCKSKEHRLFYFIGCALVVMGEMIRKCAIITAQSSFTHKIATTHCKEHKLITHGIYRYARHPAYLGWLIWAPATQLILLNPVSFGQFLAWSYYFFYERIPYEENLLVEFFGEAYEEYRAKTPTWIPFINH